MALRTGSGGVEGRVRASVIPNGSLYGMRRRRKPKCQECISRGWRIHCSVELTELSTNKHHTLSPSTRGSRDRFGILEPRESGSVIGADRRRSGPSCVLPKGEPQGQTESGGIVLTVICWSPSAQRRCDPTGRCAHRPSVTS